ncbi:hypothetical protein EG68_10207 [Paragonimus skrjabini miyazakii]|uniref:Uncharacterized protein n=1 Tax=Paragonimus skrjabini miyazakii TaxID=59628 RepID=A0A8S9YAR3_9TREM|nr:hypothetical protein EG68_10207 [Paragonimus skrjabini miyazakii]
MCAQQSRLEPDQNAHVNTESTPISYRVTVKMPELMTRNYRMQNEPLEKYVYSLKFVPVTDVLGENGNSQRPVPYWTFTKTH